MSLEVQAPHRRVNGAREPSSTASLTVIHEVDMPEEITDN